LPLKPRKNDNIKNNKTYHQYKYLPVSQKTYTPKQITKIPPTKEIQSTKKGKREMKT